VREVGKVCRATQHRSRFVTRSFKDPWIGSVRSPENKQARSEVAP
jgi:hypothetical protein